MHLEIEIGAHTYRVGKLNARMQFHVVRRLLPALAGLASVGELIAKAKAEEGVAAGLLQPFAAAIGQMDDATADFIINTSLSVVSLKQDGGGWAPVMASGGAFMFDHIDLPTMLRLAFEVLRNNLQGFFLALEQMSPGLLGAASQSTS